MTGLTAIAGALAGTAYAGPQNSDVWIGLSETDNGFLLDEDTGHLWMTGPCLKSLEPATSIGSTWISHTVELVSVGRAMATLDQRFELEITQTGAQITVVSNGRGGIQSFPASVDRACQTDGHCARLIASQQACQG